MDEDKLDDLEADIIANRQKFLKRVLETIAEPAKESEQSDNPPDEKPTKTGE